MPPPNALEPDSISELLDLALETASMAVWEWDVRSGRIQQRVSRVLELGYGPGVAPDTIEGWLPHVHAADRELAGEVVGRCLFGGGEEFLVRIRVRDPSGSYRWVKVSGRVASRDEKGVALRFIGTTQDIHHLQTVEEGVRREAELFSHIPDCIVCTDARGVVNYWNAGATALYGWTAEEMMGRHVAERFPPGPSEVRDVYAKLETNSELTAEFLDHRKDGSRVWVDARFARFGTSSGELGTLCFARDVSGRREAQERLLRDAGVLSQLRDIVVCLDPQGHVTYWNDAAERILGWKREDILGKHVSVRVPGAYAEQLKAGLARVLEGRTPPPGEWQDVRKDGSPVWISWRTELLRDRDGQMLAITAIGTDVTERRRAEEQRRKLEAQLFHAQKLESLGTMVGGIAHDFNNTLAIVLVYAELAQAHPAELPPDVSEALRQIHLAGGRARELVARLLTFGRLQKAERSVVELRSMLEDYSKLLRATLPSSIQVEVVAPEPISAVVDENQIHQVLLNLSTNAAHAMNDRGRLCLRLGQERIHPGRARPDLGLANGHYAAISVEDDGIGIEAALLSQIFEPFFTTKPAGEGTGLGLATALAIAKGHGGAIEVESDLGAGSRFTLYLPLGAEGRADPRRAALPVAGRGQRVLIVDDEEAVAILTRTALEALGYVAEHVITPERFLERYLEEPTGWDLLLIDQTMPRSTGLELGERVRTLGHRTPIVITSGFNRQLTPASLQRLERASLLNKPFDLAELSRIVATALGAEGDSVEPTKGS